MVPAGVLGLWAHPQALPVCRAISEMAGKRSTPVAAYVSDAVMGTGPCLVRGAAAAGASAEPDKGGHLQLRVAIHGRGLRELLRQSGAPRPSLANLYRRGLEKQHVLVPGCA